MKKTLALAVLATCMLTVPSLTFAANNRTEPSVRFVVTGGLTTGGDTLAELKYVHGGTTNIKGGGLVELGAGVQWHAPTSPFSLLATVNYHVDNATARNGEVRFDRIPLEVLAFYHPSAHWRIGGGWRHSTHAQYVEHFDNQPKMTIDFKDADSLVLQVGFGTRRVWGGLRYVNESLVANHVKVQYANITINDNAPAEKFDGSHMGLFGYYAF